ncbi:MAG: CPBP family intramembrane glutamic endopeptidase [Prolixibacteraceae bacterium]
MKKFIGYFKDFHQGYYNTSLYTIVFLFIGLLIGINYKFDFEDSIIDSYYGRSIRIVFYFLIHGIAFYGVLFLMWAHDKNKVNFSGQFFIKSMIGMLILGTDRAVYPFISDFLISEVPSETYRFYFKVLFNAYGLITIVATLFLVKLIFDQKSGDGFYGIQFRKVEFKPYWLMLAFMVPIIYCATWLPDIVNYYPTYKRVGGVRFAHFYQVKEWVSVFIYETVYLLDFFNTELFFRGFLIIGLSKLMGKNVVLPMVATYAVLHFGKPIGETISSVFGGYILGIIALYSRNIWGGVFLHGGIAFLMEVFAFWNK